MASVLEPRTDLRLTPQWDEPLYEVVDGQRVDPPSPGIWCSLIATRLSIRIWHHLDRRLGTVLVQALYILDEERDLRRRPDVTFVSAERWPLDRAIPETGDWAVIPDLAVEVISPNDRYGDVIAKVYEYFDHGVREVWVVEPEHRVVNVYSTPTDVEIHTHEQSLQSPLLPGLKISLADVFARRPVAAK